MANFPGPVLYSTNPWIALDITDRYLGGNYFAWVCECFDTSKAPSGSASAMIAPSSNPKRIYERLAEECDDEEEHSDSIKRYKKTFTRLARSWAADGTITAADEQEIITTVRSRSWKIWRPVIYVIPRVPIESAGRLIQVPRKDRAGYGPEFQINGFSRNEFDIIEFRQ